MNRIKNILVTGANGQLGMEFRLLAKELTQYHFLFASKEELSIENISSVEAYFAAHPVDCCINCAAYTAVDKAETEREQAIAINATAVGNLASICKQYHAAFFHFSTDYVFNGRATMPYKETDQTDPVNFYGQTKLQGEQLAISNNENAIVIRTSWVYSQFGKNFVKTMLRLMKEKESIGVVGDQVGSPTHAADLAQAVMQIIQSGSYAPGIYHYCNEGIIGWYEFALAIKELTQSPCVVKEIETSAYPTPAARPQYSALDCKKISETFSIQLQPWRKSLGHCFAKM